MSTNFYIKNYLPRDEMNPKWHIGKRSGAGGGKCLFMWTMFPIKVAQRIIEEGFNPDLGGIVSENGEEFNIQSFSRDIIGQCAIVDDSHIGEKFC
jgi:hypothetical protein